MKMFKLNRYDIIDSMELTPDEEQLYINATATVSMIEENVRLRRENRRLQDRLKVIDDMHNEQLKSNIHWAGGILGKLIAHSEK
jgi:regulator of replication initiation timing